MYDKWNENSYDKGIVKKKGEYDEENYNERTYTICSTDGLNGYYDNDYPNTNTEWLH